MKKITIYQNDADNIEVFDESDISVSECCKNLADLMKMSHIAILNIENTSVLVRPSKINSIRVEDIENEKIKQLEEIKPEEKEVVEDIITDVD